MHQAVKVFMANQRQGTAMTKTRGKVSGGNQKPWRQKGTGRARQGSIRAINWPGGGTAFGPQPREYRLQMPKKLRQLARSSALNARAQERALAIVAPLAFPEPRTKQMAELLGKMGFTDRAVLVLTAGHSPNVVLSARNLQDVAVMRFADASTYDILKADAVVIEEAALGGSLESGAAYVHEAPAARPKRAPKVAAEAKAEVAAKKPAAKKAAAKKAPAAKAKPAAKPAAAKRKPAAKKTTAKKAAPKKKKG
jgi:large subunit ribosomal protein L4